MSSHRSKRKRTSLHESTTTLNVPCGRSSWELIQPHSKRAVSLDVSSDPIEDSSSDANSFCVDDMYGCGRSSRESDQSHSKRAVHLELSSDPIEDSSSDADSFGVDDMYGTDPGIESISMNAVRPHCTSSTDQISVCTLIRSEQTDFHTLFQEGDIIHMFDRIELNVQIQSAMLNALLTAQTIHPSNVDDQATTVSSEGITSDVDSYCASTLSEGSSAARPNEVGQVSDDT